MSSPKIIRNTLAQGKYLKLTQDSRGYEFVERTKGTGVVIIIAVYEGKLILVEQYRASIQKSIIELPAGIVGDEEGKEKESLENAAGRELIEETGFEAKKLELVCFGPPSSGLSAEVVHFFYATGLTKVGPGGGDDRENITVHLVPLNEVEAFCRNRMVDPKVFAGIYFALSREKL